MKSTKYQLLQSDFDFACKQLKEYRLLIEDLRKENDLLKTEIKDWERISNKQVEHLTRNGKEIMELTDEHFDTLVYLSTLNDVVTIHKAIADIVEDN